MQATNILNYKNFPDKFLQAYGEWLIFRGEMYKNYYAHDKDPSDKQSEGEYAAFYRALNAPVCNMLDLTLKIKMILEDSGGEMGPQHFEAFKIILRDISSLNTNEHSQ